MPYCLQLGGSDPCPPDPFLRPLALWPGVGAVHPGPHSTEGPTLSLSWNTCGRLFLSSVVSQSTNHAEHVQIIFRPTNTQQPHVFFRRSCVKACSSKQGIKTGEKELWDLKKSRSRKGSSRLLAEQWAWSRAPPKGG